MKADLEFDCEDLEDEMKLKRMLLASDLCYVIFEMQQYLRTRQGVEPSFQIYNNRWAIEGSEKSFNKGQVELPLIHDIWN